MDGAATGLPRLEGGPTARPEPVSDPAGDDEGCGSQVRKTRCCTCPDTEDCVQLVLQNQDLLVRILVNVVYTCTGHSAWAVCRLWNDAMKLALKAAPRKRLLHEPPNYPTLHLEGHHSAVRAVAWSPDGCKLVTGASDRTPAVWDARSGRRLLKLTGHMDCVHAVAWSPDASKLATGSADKTAAVWDACSGRCLVKLKGHTLRIWTVAWSPDGSKLATGSSDRAVIVWDAGSGQWHAWLEVHTSWVTSVAWSPDGSKLATASFDTTPLVWDTRSWQRLATLPVDVCGMSGVPSVAWSPDGSKLATGSMDGLVAVWSVSSWQRFVRLEVHPDGVWTVAWSPDGSKLATGSTDGLVAVWDVASGSCVLAFHGVSDDDNYGAPVYDDVLSVAWSQVDGRLATSLDDKVAVWRVYV